MSQYETDDYVGISLSQNEPEKNIISQKKNFFSLLWTYLISVRHSTFSNEISLFINDFFSLITTYLRIGI